MATLTTTLGIVELTIDELRSLLSATPVPVHDSPEIASAISEVKATPKASKNSVKAEPKNSGNSTGKVISRCEAHAGKRGTVGNCQDCVRENSGNSPEQAEDDSEGNSEPQEAPKQEQRKPQRKQGGKRSGRSFEEWLDEHGEDEMTPKMESRIRWMLTDRQVPAGIAKKIAKRLDTEPKMNCRQASEIIGQLYKMPQVSA